MFYIFGAYTYFSIMGYLANIKSARRYIKEIGTIWSFYPKHYTIPPAWMQKQLRIKKKEILKYCCFKVYMANAYLFLLFINCSIYILSGFDVPTGVILYYILIGILGVDIIIELFMMVYLDRKKKKQN